MATEEYPIQRRMSDPHKTGNQVGEKRQSGMGNEKLGVEWIECRIQNSLDARNINFRVFNIGVVTVHKNGSSGQKEESGDLAETGCCQRWRFFQNLSAFL
jgi:hypothetical protein